MKTKQKEYNKVYAEYQKIKRCIESCETTEQLEHSLIMALRFRYNNEDIKVFIEVLSPLLYNLVINKNRGLCES